MSLTQEAVDVLRTLPSGGKTYVMTDTDNVLQVGLASDSCISSRQLEDARQAWSTSPSVISVNLDACEVMFCRGSAEIEHVPCSSVLPDATTASEKKAVELASRLGVIDFDDLLPEYELRTHEAHTELNVSGVMRVNHNILQHYTQTEKCTLTYRFKQSDVCILFDRENKRKRVIDE